MINWRAVDGLFGWQVRDDQGHRMPFVYRGKSHRYAQKMLAEGFVAALTGEAPACATAQPEAAAKSASASPPSNTGGNLLGAASEGTVILVLDGSKTLIVPHRLRRDGECCFNDWVSVVFAAPEEPDHKFEKWASDTFQYILGNPIEARRKNGLNGYRSSWQLTNGGGKLAWGGNGETAQLILDGHACSVAHPGWEVRLHDWMVAGLGGRSSAHLTRLDVAYDDYVGSLPLELWHSEYPSGYMFSAGGRQPKIQRLGNWHFEDGRGRTLQIGSRESGKVLRIYEKGKQLGDPNSPWVRIELELSSKAFQLKPQDLLTPTALLIGAYPCLAVLADVDEVRRLETVERATQIRLERAFEILRTQYGRYLHVFRQMLGDQECLDRLCVTDRWPEKLERIADLADAAVRLRNQSALPAVAQQG